MEKHIFSIGNNRLIYNNHEVIYKEEDERGTLTININYSGAYGMGEKYNAVNQKGKKVVNEVVEKFCYQGENTYCPAPFFFTDTGLSVYVDTDKTTSFDFKENQIHIDMPMGTPVYFSTGDTKELICKYMKIFGKAKMPPKWAFGPWISANHWKTQNQVEEQIDLLKKYQFPANVLVIEAWSDEATFYIFNGAKYKAKVNGEPFQYEDFDFSESKYWENPKEMIKKLNKEGIHLVLWQIPVYKLQGIDEENCKQNDLDRLDAIQRDLCVKNSDGTPYTIPDGNWFAGSMIPDFTNEETIKTWFDKRQYLIDIGVSGFKTDGGEFIYKEDVVFSDGTTGLDGKNRYSKDYTTEYSKFLGDDKVLFSRAGYKGQHTVPCHWSGDQQSTNEEFVSAFKSGLSAALTGIPFWGFDIAGFAGPLPTLDLYKRATQLACFCPIMQWHSEPDGGQFSLLMPGAKGNNERSPWNLANAYNKQEFVDDIRFWHWLRINLQPYIYSLALECVESYAPMMRPLVYNWNDDPLCINNETEFMLGESLLIAPLLEEHLSSRDVYLPEGNFYSFFTGKRYSGNVNSKDEIFPVFIREGYAVALNLPENEKLGTKFDYKKGYSKLMLILAGNKGKYHFRDDLGYDFEVVWGDDKVKILGKAPYQIAYKIYK